MGADHASDPQSVVAQAAAVAVGSEVLVLAEHVLLVVLPLELQLDIEVLLGLFGGACDFGQHEALFLVLLLPVEVVVLQAVLLVVQVVVGVEVAHHLVAVGLYYPDGVLEVALGQLQLRVDVEGIDVHAFSLCLLHPLPLELADDGPLGGGALVAEDVVDPSFIGGGEGVEVEVEHLGEGVAVLPAVDEVEAGGVGVGVHGRPEGVQRLLLAAAVDGLGDVSDVEGELLLDEAPALFGRTVLGDGVDEVSLLGRDFLEEGGL